MRYIRKINIEIEISGEDKSKVERITRDIVTKNSNLTSKIIRKANYSMFENNNNEINCETLSSTVKISKEL
jgi:hypothetical protein